MDESKRKQLEAKLYQLLAENDQSKNKSFPVKSISSGARVIRRRKGKADLQVA